ncbi:MAG: hypothetical protein ABGX47_10910 [Martelella sp.]|uniref:hypothetical protein n=1 Tax=Martelella sp. TaxID=1969699 RepID=UPI00324204FA
MSDRSRQQSKKRIEKDAKPQFAKKQHGGDSDGVASAKPTVITGSEDATLHRWPPRTAEQRKNNKHGR